MAEHKHAVDNHPDIGHLHVNSEVHPDVGLVHEDEEDSHMDQESPYSHHSDQDYYYEEYYLVNRGQMDEADYGLDDPGYHDHEWIEKHRVTQSQISQESPINGPPLKSQEIALHKDELWLEKHRVTKTSLVTLIPQFVTSVSADTQEREEEEDVSEEQWIADHHIDDDDREKMKPSTERVRTVSQDKLSEQSVSYPSAKLDWLLHHKVVNKLTQTLKTSSPANTPPLYTDGELSDPPGLSVTSHPDVVPSPGDGALWDDWLEHHRVTEPFIENKTDSVGVFLREEKNNPVKNNPVTAEEKPAVTQAPEKSQDDKFKEYKQIDQQVLNVPKDDKLSNSIKVQPPTTVAEAVSVTDGMSSMNATKPPDIGEQAVESAHDAMELIEENKVFSEVEDESDITAEGEGHDPIDQQDAELNAEIDKILTEKEHENGAISNNIEKDEAKSHHETADVYAPEILEASLKSSQKSNDQIKVIDQELIDAKDKLNQLESFDHKKIESGDNEDVVLQSELEKLSDEIEKDEERILELNQQVETSHHDQKSDTGRDVMVNEEISELSDSIKLLESDVSNIENSERNSAKNLKSSADRTEHVVAAKIGKMEHELDTNAKHLEKIEKELENNKQAEHNASGTDAELRKDVKLDKHLEGHEETISKNINTVEDIATKVEKGMDTLSKNLVSMQTSQQVGQEKLLTALTELSNTLVSSQHEHNKALQILTDAQQKLNSKVIEAQRRDHKPLMVVIPEPLTDSPNHIEDLDEAKTLIENLGVETAKLKNKEEDLVGVAVKQNDALRSLQEQKDETVKTLLTGADVLKNESADEEKHEKEEEKDEKTIAKLKHDNVVKGWTEWSKWSHCYGFGCTSVGKVQRFRVCQSHAEHCSGGPAWQSKSCKRTCTPKVSTNWSDWSDWSDCSTSCGSGTSSRKRTCKQPPCIGDSHETEPCNKAACNVLPLAQGLIGVQSDGGILEAKHDTNMANIDHDPSDHHAVVTCADRPCMNDGQCIQGGEGEGASPFIHFHCKCVHPNKGILCDVSCDMDTEVNGIVIGILAGILALVLLCMAYAATSSWRKKVCKYKKRSDPYQSRKKGCWETLFGCKPKCTCRKTGSDYSSNYSTCSHCSSVCSLDGHCSHCSLSHGSISAHDYNFRNPLHSHHHDEALRRNRAVKSMISLTEPSLGAMHHTSGLLGQTKSSEKNQKGSSNRTSKSSTQPTTTVDSSDDSSDSNSNDNARDHTSTLLTVSEKKTSNQSGRKNRSNNQSKRSRRQRSKPSALSPIAEERPRQLRKGWSIRKFMRLRDRLKGPKTVQKCTYGKGRGAKHRYAPPKSQARSPQPLDTTVTTDIERNLTQFVESCDQLDLPTNNSNQHTYQADPQLMKKLQQVRRRHALALLPTPGAVHQVGDRPGSADNYPLVNSYMNKWKDSGKTPAAFLPTQTSTTNQEKATPVISHVSTNQPIDDLKDWKPVSQNPLHSVWYNMETVRKPNKVKLSDSLSSAVDSLKSITSIGVKKEHLPSDQNPV